MLGGGDDGVFHVEPAVIGRHRPRAAEGIGEVALDAVVFDPARIDVHRAAVHRKGADQVVAVDIKDIDPVGEGAAEQPLRERELVIHQLFGFQVGVLGREHIHLADGGEAETLAHHRLDLGVVRQDERHAALGHPFGAGVGVVVEADAGVEGQPARDVLAEIDIARHLVHRLVGGGLVGVAVEERVPRLAAEVLVVHPDGQAVAPEERGALKPRHAQHLVARVEPVVERLLARRVAVVDAVAAPVVEEAQRAGGGAVVVAQGEGGHTARDARVVVENGFGDGAGVGGVEVGDVHVGIDAPRPPDLVTQLRIAAVLLEAHVGAVAVGAVVGAGDRAGETARLHPVGGFGLKRVVGAVAGVEVGSDAVLPHLARDDVDDAAHRVGAVEHRGGAAHDLHPLGQHRLVGVGDRVPHQPHVLGVAVDQHE